MKNLILTVVFAAQSLLLLSQLPESVFVKTNFISSEDKSLYVDQTFLLSFDEGKFVHCFIEEDSVNYCESYEFKTYKDTEETSKVYRVFIKAKDQMGDSYKMIFSFFKESSTCTVFYLDMLSLGDYTEVKN